MSTKPWYERRKPTPENPVLCWAGEGNTAFMITGFENGFFVSEHGQLFVDALPVTPIDQYTYWHGGECPVAGETVVGVIHRNGEKATSKAHAFTPEWMHKGVKDVDIIAYRIHVED